MASALPETDRQIAPDVSAFGATGTVWPHTLPDNAFTSRAIEDPVEQGPEVCDRVYARIERCVGELANALGDVEREREG